MYNSNLIVFHGIYAGTRANHDNHIGETFDDVITRLLGFYEKGEMK